MEYIDGGSQLDGNTCISWPAEAKEAFRHATAIWSDVLQNRQTLNVQACLSASLPAGAVGESSYTLYPVPDYLGSGTITWLPQALNEHIFRREVSTEVTPDIQIIVNGNLDFYYGTDANPPPTQVDLVTVVAHELGHGLGMTESGRLDDGDPTNGTECDGEVGTGCIGYQLDEGIGNPYYPTAFDLYVNAGIDGAPLYLERPNPGQRLANLLTGSEGDLIFDEANQNDGTPERNQFVLYTPSTFSAEKSYNHLTGPDQLMYHTIAPGTAIHDVGAARSIMRELGWPAAEPNVLPVELTQFTAERQEAGVLLNWQTDRETENAGFTVEARRGTGEFESIAWIPGSGTTADPQSYTYFDAEPTPGVNYYRLRQTNFDQTEEYSHVVGIRITAEDAPSMLYPNPVTGGEVYLDYTSTRSADLLTRWYDRTGQLV
ncbi:MAG: hypothetical protein WA952_12640, partial [Lewinella sp.]